MGCSEQQSITHCRGRSGRSNWAKQTEHEGSSNGAVWAGAALERGNGSTVDVLRAQHWERGSEWRQGEEEEAQGKRAGEQKAGVYLSSTHVQREVNKAQKWLSSSEITKKAGAGPALPACSAWDQQSLQQIKRGAALRCWGRSGAATMGKTTESSRISRFAAKGKQRGSRAHGAGSHIGDAGCAWAALTASQLCWAQDQLSPPALRCHRHCMEREVPDHR